MVGAEKSKKSPTTLLINLKSNVIPWGGWCKPEAFCFYLVRAGERRRSLQMEAGKLQGTEAAHGAGARQLGGRQLPRGSQETARGAAVGAGP